MTRIDDDLSALEEVIRDMERFSGERPQRYSHIAARRAGINGEEVRWRDLEKRRIALYLKLDNVGLSREQEERYGKLREGYKSITDAFILKKAEYPQI